MTNATLEERVAALEQKVAALTGEATENTPPLPWWEQIAGTFKDNPQYDEAMRLGRQYRESLRPEHNDNKAGA